MHDWGNAVIAERTSRQTLHARYATVGKYFRSQLGKHWFKAALAWCVVGISAPNANALQYSRVPFEPPDVAVNARGAILPGDFDRFVEFLRTLPRPDHIILILDSPGGSITEAEKFAFTLRKLQTWVAVFNGNECASACFLLFAGAPYRFMGKGALIGVHSASDAVGREDLDSLAATTLMARDLSNYGVPAQIIGKLVQTLPASATWLTLTDLISMGVTILDRERQSAH